MLKALYDYAVEQQLTLPPGFAYKLIKAYISLSANGAFLGIMPGGTEAVLCPDIGSLANGTDKSNAVAEKVSVLQADNAKNAFFRRALKDGGEFEPKLQTCLAAMETPETMRAINEAFDREKLKPTDRVSFRVDGRSVLVSEAMRAWWSDYRKQFLKSVQGQRTSLCLITGQPTVPMATVPVISGLSVVGGHSKGDALICFDKASFCSYDLKQSANAPVSEEAFYAVKAALDALLKGAPILCGMKFVHWYDRSIAQETEVDESIGELIPDAEDANEDIATEDTEAEEGNEEEERDPVKALLEGKKADDLIAHVRDGGQPLPLPNLYFIMLLSGVNGRVMVRRYEHGSYEQLQEKLAQWDREIQLVKARGRGYVKRCKLASRMICLMKYQKNDLRPFERMGKELAGIEPAVLMAILQGLPLQDSVAIRALNYIRSQLMAAGDEDRPANSRAMPLPDARACQWLKLWLIRKDPTSNKEELLMGVYNPQYPGVAYHCGALMCVYANLQAMAMKNVNANVVQRFYASACQTPGLVLGRLSIQANHHLEKLTSRYEKQHFIDELARVAAAVEGRIPATLELTEQAEFALGYYQKQAEENAYRAALKDAYAKGKTASGADADNDEQNEEE